MKIRRITALSVALALTASIAGAAVLMDMDGDGDIGRATVVALGDDDADVEDADLRPATRDRSSSGLGDDAPLPAPSAAPAVPADPADWSGFAGSSATEGPRDRGTGSSAGAPTTGSSGGTTPSSTGGATAPSGPTPTPTTPGTPSPAPSAPSDPAPVPTTPSTPAPTVPSEPTPAPTGPADPTPGPTAPGDHEPEDPAPTFTTALTIPPLADSHVDEDGTRVFELTAQEGSMSFHPGQETTTWGFNGDFLGPTLRARQGEQVAVEFTNAIGETTSVHWHGMHLPPEMDGGPHQEVQPGATWRPTWLIDQPAATLWYHPHPHGLTEKHVYYGLSGMFILDDDTSDASGLPSDYGVDDIPVIVQDKDFDEDGEFTLVSQVPSGVMGQTIMVNGTVGAVQEVTTERVRLRILNGSTLRSYNFGFDDDRPFQLVATDGGLLEQPHTTTRIQLTPAERAEIVVELAPGEDVMLRSYPQDLGNISDPVGYGALQTRDILRLQAAAELAPSLEVAQGLSSYGRLAEGDATVTRSFVMRGLRLNGELMDMNRIDEVVTVGTTEIWEITNLDPFPHNFHIHDVQFEVLTVDGQAPPPELAGRKDTIYTAPGQTIRLIMKFEHYADADTPYMYHCHLLRHEDFGLMGQFVVVEPGTEPPKWLPGAGHDHGHEGEAGHEDDGHEDDGAGEHDGHEDDGAGEHDGHEHHDEHADDGAGHEHHDGHGDDGAGHEHHGDSERAVAAVEARRVRGTRLATSPRRGR